MEQGPAASAIDHTGRAIELLRNACGLSASDSALHFLFGARLGQADHHSMTKHQYKESA